MSEQVTKEVNEALVKALAQALAYIARTANRECSQCMSILDFLVDTRAAMDPDR